MTAFSPVHPRLPRRHALQAGSIGLLGLGMNHVTALRAADAVPQTDAPPARSVIYIFLSGGLGQHDSFDMKPDAPEEIRGEFRPISTSTPGTQICEHLPRLAQRSHLWSLVRSLTHPYNEHSQGHMVMLSGRSKLPPTFNAAKPTPLDWPSIAAIAGDQTVPRNNLPPAVALPERLVHRTGRVIPGQFAGVMGSRRDPWFIEAAPFNGTTYGAFPEYEFHHARGPENRDGLKFQAPNLTLPEGLGRSRVDRRLDLLRHVEEQRVALEQAAPIQQFDQYRQAAISLLSDPSVRHAFDVVNADDDVQDRYGRNSFGWSLLMARRLVEAGVNLVQVNLGNNETWDTHGNAFPHLKDQLYPPTDRALAALLDDLHERGMLESTLIVVAGEFGRTPKTSLLPRHYAQPGRDHWGGVQTVLLAGGGVKGGRVIGSSDKQGAYPADDPQRPENLAATIYQALGLPATAAWNDDLGRPHHIFHGDPIGGLT
ncbi:hypothetical protein Mal4_42850 [Maioricimonas rarisocia]|uniref:DUF1501 domain-containing protein n=1 Tax=Maioricimonas rarisocia TaxID=2528026 RepID=A0A517ZBW9_9PLAN|nr:DUF1501 domain-containing protein [Maioricimonas rarisocia]QDU39931.1 hypothetical protein Mal4_42850 [Maioricimonas rarisocia]